MTSCATHLRRTPKPLAELCEMGFQARLVISAPVTRLCALHPGTLKGFVERAACAKLVLISGRHEGLVNAAGYQVTELKALVSIPA